MKNAAVYLLYISVGTLAGVAFAGVSCGIFVSSSDNIPRLALAVCATAELLVLIAGPVAGLVLALRHTRSQNRRRTKLKADPDNPYPPA